MRSRHRLARSREQRALRDLLAQQEELRADALGERLGRAAGELHLLAARLLLHEVDERALAARRLAFDARRGLGKRARPARAAVGLLGAHHEHDVGRIAQCGDARLEPREQRLGAAPPRLGLAQQHEPARRQDRQRAERVVERAGGAALAVQPVEVEVARTVGQHRALERPARVVAQQRLGAGEEIGGAQPARGELGLELVGRHGTARSKSESCTRPANSVETRRIASSRFLRVTSMSALAK